MYTPTDFYIKYVFTFSLHNSIWSIDFDHTVDLAHKPEASKESNSASQEEKQKDHDQSVTKVEKCRYRSGDGELGEKVMDAISKQVESREARCQKGSPPK